jgi:hypothetical protein
MTSKNLHAASSQWSKRPADERFWTLSDARDACDAARRGSTTLTLPMKSLRVSTLKGHDPKTAPLTLQGPNGGGADFTHYSFGQLCSSIGAPAKYLRTLPSNLAAAALNAGIEAKADDRDRSLLFHQNGKRTLRAMLGTKYDRVWDADLLDMLLNLHGWRAPAGRAPVGYVGPTRAALAQDILEGQINIQPGDTIAPSGIYASDHDLFVFLVAPDRIVTDGAGHVLMRGLMVHNSEVGDSSLRFVFFLCEHVCGNHIIWNATGVHEISVRHVGKDVGPKAFKKFEAQLSTYLNAADSESGKIAAARRMVLGKDKKDVLAAVLAYTKKHSISLTEDTVDNALTVAAQHTDWYGDPNTVWAAVSGLTHASQGQHADTRTDTDRAAAKLLQMAF